MKTLTPLQRRRRADLIRDEYVQEFSCDAESPADPQTGYVHLCQPDIEVTVQRCGCYVVAVHHQCNNETEYEYGWCMAHYDAPTQTYEEAIADVRIIESNKRLETLEAIERR